MSQMQKIKPHTCYSYTTSKSILLFYAWDANLDMFSLALKNKRSTQCSTSALINISTLDEATYSFVPFPQILKWSECTHYMAINLDMAD